jgi:transcriptional regulator with XRE-family HTH domain
MDQGLTQEQLADRSGVPQTTISDVETGRIGNPSWDVVHRLSSALGVEPKDLFPPASTDEGGPHGA